MPFQTMFQKAHDFLHNTKSLITDEFDSSQKTQHATQSKEEIQQPAHNNLEALAEHSWNGIVGFAGAYVWPVFTTVGDAISEAATRPTIGLGLGMMPSNLYQDEFLKQTRNKSRADFHKGVSQAKHFTTEALQVNKQSTSYQIGSVSGTLSQLFLAGTALTKASNVATKSKKIQSVQNISSKLDETLPAISRNQPLVRQRSSVGRTAAIVDDVPKTASGGSGKPPNITRPAAGESPHDPDFNIDTYNKLIKDRHKTHQAHIDQKISVENQYINNPPASQKFTETIKHYTINNRQKHRKLDAKNSAKIQELLSSGTINGTMKSTAYAAFQFSKASLTTHFSLRLPIYAASSVPHIVKREISLDTWQHVKEKRIGPPLRSDQLIHELNALRNNPKDYISQHYVRTYRGQDDTSKTLDFHNFGELIQQDIEVASGETLSYLRILPNDLYQLLNSKHNHSRSDILVIKEPDPSAPAASKKTINVAYMPPIHTNPDLYKQEIISRRGNAPELLGQKLPSFHWQSTMGIPYGESLNYEIKANLGTVKDDTFVWHRANFIQGQNIDYRAQRNLKHIGIHGVMDTFSHNKHMGYNLSDPIEEMEGRNVGFGTFIPYFQLISRPRIRIDVVNTNLKGLKNTKRFLQAKPEFRQVFHNKDAINFRPRYTKQWLGFDLGAAHSAFYSLTKNGGYNIASYSDIGIYMATHNQLNGLPHQQKHTSLDFDIDFLEGDDAFIPHFLGNERSQNMLDTLDTFMAAEKKLPILGNSPLVDAKAWDHEMISQTPRPHASYISLSKDTVNQSEKLSGKPQGSSSNAPHAKLIASLKQVSSEIYYYQDNNKDALPVKKALQELGYLQNFERDISFKRDDYKALLAFQKDHSLVPDGMISPESSTLKLLIHDLSHPKTRVKPTESLTIGSSSPLITKVKKRLIQDKLYFGDPTPNWDPLDAEFTKALDQFQKTHYFIRQPTITPSLFTFIHAH